MELTEERLLETGWSLIGSEGILKYYAKESEDGEILYVPVHEKKAIGNVRSITKELVGLLSGFITQ